ncbi:hypothetical protein GCM10027065_24500 [Rhodanobacter koreensis]
MRPDKTADRFCQCTGLACVVRHTQTDAMKKSDAAALLLLGALWGASFLFMRMGANQFGGMALAGMRAIGAAICSIPLLNSRERLAELRMH